MVSLKYAASVFSGLLLASLALFASTAGAQEKQNEAPAGNSGLPPGFAEVESQFGVEETVSRIEGAVQSADGASVVTTVNHAQNAQGAGLDLRPTQVILFGKPALGRPLMQANQVAGLDLPQKMLVYEDAQGQTHVAYNDPYYVAGRHGVEGADDELQKISTALQGFAEQATGNQMQTPQTGGTPPFAIGGAALLGGLVLLGAGGALYRRRSSVR